MPRFFVQPPVGDEYRLTGENARHANLSLRIKVGEEIVICTGDKFEYNTIVSSVSKDSVNLKVIKKIESSSELSTNIHLYQCLVKGDKMEYIIQKAVELGVKDITPVVSSRCISKISDKDTKKLDRWNKISIEAAKQSGRGVIPKILNPIKFENALKQAKGDKIFFYENSKQNLKQYLSTSQNKDLSLFIGPEGGFSLDEVEKAIENEFSALSLGKRILRAETASLSALSIISYEKENL